MENSARHPVNLEAAISDTGCCPDLRRHKMKFYCLQVEFYADGKVLTCVTTSNKRGHSQYRQVPGMVAFKLWWHNVNYAKQLLESVKSGEVGEDDILTIYSEFKEWEDEVLFKGKAA